VEEILTPEEAREGRGRWGGAGWGRAWVSTPLLGGTLGGAKMPWGVLLSWGGPSLWGGVMLGRGHTVREGPFAGGAQRWEGA